MTYINETYIIDIQIQNYIFLVLKCDKLKKINMNLDKI